MAASSNRTVIPVVDLFAGPGGLGEGFASFREPAGRAPFDIRLSIEKDELAHETLELRAFFRQFPDGTVPLLYYKHLRGGCSRQALFDEFPAQVAAARVEAWHTELGSTNRDTVRVRIQEALAGAAQWVLIGGPPCQAYSLVGRARNRGIAGYTLERDARTTLYVEYLRVIADHWPSAFVMENVKGILSAELGGAKLFGRILEDLADPAGALGATRRGRFKYDLHALADNGSLLPVSPSEFVVRSELYGVPQARHRVIIVGIRSDLRRAPDRLLSGRKVDSAAVLDSLPALRSGLSRGADGNKEWIHALRTMKGAPLRAIRAHDRVVAGEIADLLEAIEPPAAGRGDGFVGVRRNPRYRPDWFGDANLRGVCNHASRGHMVGDLHRYLFAACYAAEHGRSPSLGEFPSALLPDHDNVGLAITGSMFGDRFRVQLGTQPSSTITSHIAKDGHYYIHPDPAQCRSLTVREAARLQTFPDNYLFCGPRTSQYAQVGNAVPPLLAYQIAAALYPALT